MPPNDDEVLLPIQVGKSLTDIDLHIQSDNEVNGQPCDNISEKNRITVSVLLYIGHGRTCVRFILK